MTDPAAAILRSDGEQVDVHALRKETGNDKADDHITIARDSHFAVGVPNVASDGGCAPSMAEPVLDEVARHLGEDRRERNRRGPELHQGGHEAIMAYRVTGSATPW